MTSVLIFILKEHILWFEWCKCPPCPCWGLKVLKSYWYLEKAMVNLCLSVLVLQVCRYNNICVTHYLCVRMCEYCAFAVLKNATLAHSCSHLCGCESFTELLVVSLFLRMAAKILLWASPPDTLLFLRPWLSLLLLPQVFLMLVLGDEVISTFPGAYTHHSINCELFCNPLFQFKQKTKSKLIEFNWNWQYELSGKTVSAQNIDFFIGMYPISKHLAGFEIQLLWCLAKTTL